jgi:lipopolysaccharide export system ATP-binding protein
MTQNLILRGENLKKIYKKRSVVNKVSVQVEQGEVVGLLGPNGAGKTTTFYMIVGMIKPNEGKVFLDNAEITDEPMYKRAKMGIGYLPQEASVFRRLSVEDNIMAVLQMLKITHEERKNIQEQLLNELGLINVRKSQGFQLSGGERRRCEIARALAMNPKFILLDEPFAGVDPIATEDIMNIVANLKLKGIGVLITDHNVHETLSIVDRAYILINGEIFKSGTATDLAEDADVRKLYLGEKFRLDRYS